MTGSQWNLEVPFDGMGALGSNAWIPGGGQALSGGAWMQNGGQSLGGGTWMQNDGGLAINGGAWMQNGDQALGGGGTWMQNGGSNGMYLNQLGMNNLYHNNLATPSGGLSSGMFVPGYQQNYQVAQYEGGFQGSYMRPAMSFYPMPGMFGMDRRNCFFNRGFGVPGWNQNPILPQQTPIFQQVNPTPTQPVQIVPMKTVQPVQPVQHLKVETVPPIQVQPKNSAGRVPFQIPKAKTPWEGRSLYAYDSLHAYQPDETNAVSR